MDHLFVSLAYIHVGVCNHAATMVYETAEKHLQCQLLVRVTTTWV